MKLIAISMIVALAVVWLNPAAARAEPSDTPWKIEEISVRLVLNGSYVGLETMDQLEFALLDTVELALIGQLEGDLNYIEAHQQSVVSTLGEVIETALEKRGFELEQLALDAGRITLVTIDLHLAAQRVTDFSVQFHLQGDAPVIEAAVSEDIAAISAGLYSDLARTPYNDARWISSMVTDSIDVRLASMPAYSGYDWLVTVLPGELTEVAVSFTPKHDEQALFDHRLVMRSLSLPQIMLDPIRQTTANYLQSLVGAPTSFIAAKQNSIRQVLYQHLISNCGLADTGADLTIRLRLVGCSLEVHVLAESSKYFLGGQGRLDLWDHDRSEYVGRLSARLGFQPEPGWPVYLFADYFPGATEVYPMLGAGRIFDGDAFAGAGWDFEAESWRFQGLSNVSRDVFVRADIYAEGAMDEQSEISVHYRFKDVYELQLVTNFGGTIFAAVAADL